MATFRRDGWLLIPGALTEDHRCRLEAAVDQVYAEQQQVGGTRPDGLLHLLGFLTRHELFGQLLDHPTTFGHVWNNVGWNIYSHHNHLDVTLPAPHDVPPVWGLAPGRIPAELRPGIARR